MENIEGYMNALIRWNNAPHILNNKKIDSLFGYGCTQPQSKGEVGYVFRLNKPNEIVEDIQH